MTGAIVIRWSGPKTGREVKSLETFGRALAYYDGLAKQGRIHGHHEYLQLVGKPGGFMIIDGPVDELLKVQVEEGTRRLITEANVNVADLTVEVFVGGSEGTIQQQIALYGETLQSQGLMV